MRNNAAKLYTKIRLLTETELRIFLLEIAKAMAQRCEINAYGAFKFNMEDIVSVTSVKSSCRGNVIAELLISDLLEIVKKDRLEGFRNLLTNFPWLTESSRMRAYLKSHAKEQGKVWRMLIKLHNTEC